MKNALKHRFRLSGVLLKLGRLILAALCNFICSVSL